MNQYRRRILDAKTAEFNATCQSNIQEKRNGNVEYVSAVLKASTVLCLLRNSLCKMENFADGIGVDVVDFYEENADSLHETILGLTEASEEENLKRISSILKTLEDKNKLVVEEESKYDQAGNINSIFQKRLEASPDHLASREWNRVQRTNRGNNTGIVDNRVLYEQYFENFAKHFTEQESRTFIDALNKAAVTFSAIDPLLQNIRELLSYAITRLYTHGSINDISDEDVSKIVEIADSQNEFIEHHDLDDMSNFEETKHQIAREMLGGARNRMFNPLCATNDRGLPYSPVVSYLSNNLHAALKNNHEFIQNDAYLPHEYNEYDEDQRGAPDERHLLNRRTIENIPTSETERTRQYTVYKEGGNRFRLPNPLSSFHLVLYTLELFLQDTERKIKTSSYLPEFIAYFFVIKRYADELILICETVTPTNLVDRFNHIFIIGSIFNLLFHSFPYLENGEGSIGELLHTDRSSEFSRITMNLIYQYAGTVEYDKTHVKTIETNIKMLLKSNTWNAFINHVGKNMTNDMFHLFRQYDNSTLLIFLGSIDLSSKLSLSEIHEKLNHFHRNRIYSSNLTMEALFSSEEKAESKRRYYKRHQDSMFHKFLFNLKNYNRRIFGWKLKDILNNPGSAILKKSPSPRMDVQTPPKSNKKRGFASSSIRESSKKRQAISASGGRKTRRNRK